MVKITAIPLLKQYVLAVITLLSILSSANAQTAGTVTVVPFQPGGIAIDAGGYMYILDQTNGMVVRLNPDYSDNSSNAILSWPNAIAVNPQGNAYITHGNGETRVAVLSQFGSIITFDAHLPSATNEYRSIAVATYGAYTYLYIGTQDQYIVQVDITNIGSPITTAITFPDLNSTASIAIDRDGNFYIADISGGAVWKGVPVRNPVTGSITSFDQLSAITNIGVITGITDGSAASDNYVAVNSMAADAYGNLYFSTNDGYIARITGDYMYTIAADASGNPYNNIAVDAVANIYFSDQGNINKINAVVSTLPVTWISFTVKKQNQSAIVSWSTATEQNTKDFTVQHSIDGINWNTAAILTAAGNSSVLRNYTYVHDHTAKGYNYYRIMQTDLDGKKSYTEMRMINLSEDNAAFTIIGNRISNGVLQLQVHQTTTISLYEASGKLLWVKQFTPGMQSIDVSTYNKGIYLLKSKEKAQKILIQ